MPVVLITPEAMLHKAARYVDLLQSAGFEVRYPDDPTFTRGLHSEQETIAQLSVCDAVLAGGEVFTRRVLFELPRLRVIARSGVGYDRVDIPAATERRIPVTITPTANHEAVAEQTLALLLAVAKSVLVNDRHSRAGRWPMQATAPVRGSTLGIVGLGRIGRSLAVRARALGMHVLATESFPDHSFVGQNGIELVEFDDLLARSDYLSLHCPLNGQTHGLFNRTLFAKMKPGSVLLNTARGKLVVESDLLEALKSGHLRGAGLDVFEQEPPSPDNPLFALDNVVFSPHIAGSDHKSQLDMGIEAAECIIRLYQGEWPTGAVVNDELRSGWRW